MSPQASTMSSFENAKTRRQMTRAAGLNPNYWYAVEQSATLKVGKVFETRFWGRSIAIFRGDDGQLGAIENRCLHRQIKLSGGEVEGCRLTCPYHGWSYDRDGRVTAVPHELFGRDMPATKLASFPTQERYGLIWLYPGSGDAEAARLPEIPELEGADAWTCVPVDFTWNAHHSMIIENVSDFTHAYLHRKFRPFNDAALTYCDGDDRRVRLGYDVLVGDGPISKHFVNRKKVNVNKMDLCFDYPYQWSNTDDRIKHYCFFLPLDDATTRVFFLFYFDALKIPLTPLSVPRWLMKPLLQAANRLLIRPLLSQDGDMVEAEQLAFQQNQAATAIELNPAVLEFQKLIVAQWRSHLADEAERAGRGAVAAE